MIIRLLLSVLILSGIKSHAAGWIAKIDNAVLDLDEFKKVINIQKYMVGNDKNLADPMGGEFEKRKLLDSFIEEKIILDAASQKGFSSTHKDVINEFTNTRSTFLAQFFLAREIDVSQIDIKEADMNTVYLQEKRNLPKEVTYEQIKPQIYQKLYLEKMSALRDNYQKKLEGSYKVRRFKLDDFYIASVSSSKGDEQKIKKSAMEDEYQKQIQQLTEAYSMKESELPAAKITELKTKIREELLLARLIEMEIIRTGFEKQTMVKDALVLFQNEIIKDQFFQKEFISKIKITDGDIAAEHDRNKKAYENMSYEQVRRLISDRIRMGKAQATIKEFLEDKKMEARIIINKEELGKLK